MSYSVYRGKRSDDAENNTTAATAGSNKEDRNEAAYRRIAHHGVSLARPRLSVGEHADIVAEKRRIQHPRTKLRVHLTY